MFEGTAYLKSNTGFTYDAYGNEIVEETRRKVYVKPRTVFSAEFYQAAQSGLHPTITFEMSNRADYKDEGVIEYNGKNYTVVRVDWTGDRDTIRLVCEERIGNDEVSE